MDPFVLTGGVRRAGFELALLGANGDDVGAVHLFRVQPGREVLIGRRVAHIPRAHERPQRLGGGVGGHQHKLHADFF